MNLHFWPRMRIKHPTHVKGQLYIPMINLAMYIGVVIIILLFRDSSHMEAAYGLAITITMLMTTLLLGFYLHSKGVSRVLTILFMGAYCTIEAIFLAANLSKFLAGGWCTMLIGGILFLMMYVWVRAMKIRHHYIRTKPLDDYYQIISDIKADVSIPKYASNLVYINHANKEGTVDNKLLYSIINKQPKRADHYWLINMEFADTPDTLEYRFDTLVPDTLYSITMRIGFRIEPRVSLYLRQVVEDLVADGKVDLTSSYPSLRKKRYSWRFPIHHHPPSILSGEFRQPPAEPANEYVCTHQQDRHRRTKGIGTRHFYGGGRTCTAHHQPTQRKHKTHHANRGRRVSPVAR